MQTVVIHSISTSNHNPYESLLFSQSVVIHSISTSNHNLPLAPIQASISCNSFYFYIKPQLCCCFLTFAKCCNSFYFYIKPQLCSVTLLVVVVVIHSISTSNHNRMMLQQAALNVVIHSISTSNHNLTHSGRFSRRL